MGRFTENMIKGAITETIVEELLRDLGFFVLKLGQEHTVSPLIQLTNFVASCGGNFKLDNDIPRDYISNLPDFVIVDKNGNVNFLEVKFRANSFLKDRHKEVFSLYPTFILVVNLYVDEDYFRQHSDRGSFHFPIPKEIRDSRFHVWKLEGIEENTDKGLIGIGNFEKWLEVIFRIKVNNEIKDKIRSYEKLVEKWLRAR